MKAIKKKTYHNFMIIYKQMQRKGYDKTEAEKITHRIFNQYESCPEGMSIRALADMIIPANE